MGAIDFIGPLTGLAITLASRSSITVAAGNAGGITLAAPITKTDSVWSAGDGNGGILVTSALTGTVTVSSGTDVVGSGTSFFSDYAVNSTMTIGAGTSSSAINSIESDTVLKLRSVVPNGAGLAHKRGGQKGDRYGVILITNGTDVDVSLSSIDASGNFDTPSGWTGVLIGYVSFSLQSGIISLYTPEWVNIKQSSPREAIFSGEIIFNSLNEVTVSSINTSTGVITATADHNLVTGQPIVAYSGTWSGGTLTNGRTYFARIVSATEFTVHYDLWSARGVGLPISFGSGPGSGTRVFRLLAYNINSVSYGLDPVAPFVPSGLSNWLVNFYDPYSMYDGGDRKAFSYFSIKGICDEDGVDTGIPIPTSSKTTSWVDGSLFWQPSALKFINTSNVIKAAGTHAQTFGASRTIFVDLNIKW